MTLIAISSLIERRHFLGLSLHVGVLEGGILEEMEVV